MGRFLRDVSTSISLPVVCLVAELEQAGSREMRWCGCRAQGTAPGALAGTQDRGALELPSEVMPSHPGGVGAPQSSRTGSPCPCPPFPKGEQAGREPGGQRLGPGSGVQAMGLGLRFRARAERRFGLDLERQQRREQVRRGGASPTQSENLWTIYATSNPWQFPEVSRLKPESARKINA